MLQSLAMVRPSGKSGLMVHVLPTPSCVGAATEKDDPLVMM